jgi:hypothetical protein
MGDGEDPHKKREPDSLLAASNPAFIAALILSGWQVPASAACRSLYGGGTSIHSFHCTPITAGTVEGALTFSGTHPLPDGPGSQKPDRRSALSVALRRTYFWSPGCFRRRSRARRAHTAARLCRPCVRFARLARAGKNRSISSCHLHFSIVPRNARHEILYHARKANHLRCEFLNPV